MDYLKMLDLFPQPDDTADDAVLTPESLEAVMKNTFAPDPKTDEVYKGFNFDAGLEPN
jgi:hypothetical protein